MDIKEKILQMFILGFSGKEINAENKNIQTLVQNGLGGVIYFAENIESYEQTLNLSKNLQNIAKIPLFVSIDQEGGKIERTVNIKNKIKYLSPAELAKKNDVNLIKQQTQIMAEELKSMGVNMNFAPVLDVNTNPNNPVIGIRSFGDNAEDVIKLSEPVYTTLAQNNIIPVGKHFPGHGDTSVDSHIDMPVVEIKFQELESLHIKPFIAAINNGMDALMIAHVFYKAFNSETLPASLSKEIITDYLKNKLNFKGLIVSDDMIMGGISKNYGSLEACQRSINAGMDLFIFRNSDDETVNLIENLADSVKNGIISEARIDESIKKILYFKKKYRIF